MVEFEAQNCLFAYKSTLQAHWVEEVQTVVEFVVPETCVFCFCEQLYTLNILGRKVLYFGAACGPKVVVLQTVLHFGHTG